MSDLRGRFLAVLAVFGLALGSADLGYGGVWMESFECQMIEGGTGDFLMLSGKRKYSLTVEAEQRGKETYFKPGAPPVTRSSGRINWYGRDPGWKDVKGFRGEQD